MPERYQQCFDNARAKLGRLPDPSKGYTLAQTIAIIGALVASEKITAKCGDDLIVWANRQAASAKGQ